jgi:hypothetical protein
MLVNGWTALALLVGNAIVLVLSMGISMILPAAPLTNRKAYVPNSRYRRTPLPAGAPSGGLPGPRATGSPVVAG